MSAREIELLQELRWRHSCRNSLIEYARTIPIPGVPLSDNYEQLVESGVIKPKGEYKDGKFIEWYDGRYDGNLIIPQLDTKPAAHHILVYGIAQKIIEGTLISPEGEICRRMMVMEPPGSGKSTKNNVVIPTWAIGKFGHEIVLASCADMIAKKHGKRARQVVGSEEYNAVFEVQIDANTRAADQWATINGGSYLSAGIHGALMGNRADGLLGDDLMRGRAAAESQTERDNTWDAYTNDARTRKKPTAWEILGGTRWHEDDVMGRILPEGWAGESGFIKGRDGYLWYVVCLQAQVEVPGDPLGRPIGAYLWEEWFNEGGDPDRYWAPLKLDTRSWSSLYQQVPTPPEGDFFKEAWVRYYDYLPKNVNYYVSGDYAVTPRGEGVPDWTSIGVWAVDSEGVIYFVDGWHGQTSPDHWIETAIDYFAAYKPLAHVAGKGPVRRGTEPFLKIRMRDRSTFTVLEWYEESYSKETNAQAFRAAMACGMVHWPRNNEEAAWIIRHLVGFGTLKIDDPVDMCAMIGRHVAHVWGPAKPKPEPPALVIQPGEIKASEMMKRRKRA